MSEIDSTKKSICAIIPTYNNAATLEQVVRETQQFVKEVIVVNDGSTDDTPAILNNIKDISILSWSKNRGKGYALRRGFQYAWEKGYRYALTLDSDGQHDPGDIPLFLEKLTPGEATLIIGARNMDHEGVPGRSNFGRKFSNFWFWVETGIHHPDTQSGFRLYPLAPIHAKHWITRRFEFEIEVIVRLAWQGVKITHVPVSVHYEKEENRISHFRPFIDFTRISILNTFLVFIALFYIKPRNLFRLYSRKSLKEHLNEQIIDTHFSNLRLALSVGLGIFMGIVPIWGYQLVTAIFLAYLFKLHKPLVIISANISIPPMIPVILYGSIKCGEWLLRIPTNLSLDSGISIETVKSVLLVYITGSIALAVLSGTVSFIISYFVFAFTRKPRNK